MLSHVLVLLSFPQDGVFLDVAPRDIQELPLYGGARCDILVKCSESAVGQEVHLVAFPARRINSELEQFNGTVLRVGIAASADPTPASVIPEFKVNFVYNRLWHEN